MQNGTRRLLFVFKSVPYPLRAHGGSVRYLPILRYLSKSQDIDLIIINSEPAELRYVDGLQKFCRKISLLSDPRNAAHTAFSKARTYAEFCIPSSPPYSVVAHDERDVTRGIAKIAGSECYDILIWVGGYLLPTLFSALREMSVAKVLVDFIDSPYLWAARTDEMTFRLGPLARYELWKTCRWEGEVIRKLDGAIYVSRVDAEAVPSRLAPMEKRFVIPNGVNISSSPPKEPVSLPSPNLGFLGNMSYPPNIEAVEWLYREVFAPLRESHRDLNLVVIGRDPTPSIRRIGIMPGVIVTGTVENIWEYIHGVDIFLFPLQRGAGLKNKILEAMYARRPVVTTPLGNEGLDAIPGKHVSICKAPEEFQAEVHRLLQDPVERVRIGNAAHAFVAERFSWDRILLLYERMLTRVAAG